MREALNGQGILSAMLLMGLLSLQGCSALTKGPSETKQEEVVKKPAFPIPHIDDRALLKMVAEPEYQMPERIFSEELIAAIKAEKVPHVLRGGKSDRAVKWLTIPEEDWQELIADFAPVNLGGNNLGVAGKCPFTGKKFFGKMAEMTDTEFLSTPFQARGKDGFLVYARSKDMPQGYRAEPNVTVEIPHLNGRVRTYHFFAPKGTEDAGEEYNSGRRHWFSSEGVVWKVRLRHIMNKVLPDLAARVFADDDPKAARTMAAILDRFADVYPGLPLYSQCLGHGFARTRDKKRYLTKKDYRGDDIWSYQLGYRRPYWFNGIYDYNYDKLNWGISSWTDGINYQGGQLAAYFDLIKDKEAVKEFSKEKYRHPGRWEKKIRKKLLPEVLYLCKTAPPTWGNTMHAYLGGAPLLAIATQDRELFSDALSWLEVYFANNWFADGMASDGAFNYAMMTYGLLKYRWLNKFFGDVDLADRFPIVKRADELTARPVVTLYNIGSKHADQHARFFRSRRPWQYPPAPDTIKYEAHEASQCLPIYGLTCLRAGAPGSRMEVILDHQNTGNHVHYSKLNVQLFYEGIELLPDFGYSVGWIDPEREPWKSVQKDYRYKLLGSPCEQDKWAPWRHNYALYPEAHCVAMVDQWLYRAIPTRLHRYFGAKEYGSPNYWAQFVDAGASGLFKNRPNPVGIFRRQLVPVTLPGGRSFLVDIFRIDGGKRHDLFWHVANDRMETSLKNGKAIKEPNLQAYWKQKSNYDKVTGAFERHYSRAGQLITDLVKYPIPEGGFQLEYLIQPSSLMPKNPETLKQYSHWPKILHDVALKLWGYAEGSRVSDSELIEAKGPWPGILEEYDPETKSLTAGLTVVGFKDAISYLIESRIAEEPGLKSTFVHFLEPRNPDQKQVIERAAVIDRQELSEGGGVTCAIALKNGDDVLVVTTLNGEEYRNDTITLKGRMGAAIPNKHCFTLYDGTAFSGRDFSIKLAPSWKMKLLGVIGDLTGSLYESALIVETEQALPMDDTLQGKLIYVSHQAGGYHTAYTIARISEYGEGQYRIELQYTPPFIQYRMKVLRRDPEDPRKIFQNFTCGKGDFGEGIANHRGRIIRFLRSGFESVMESGGRTKVAFSDPAPEGAVKAGDRFVVYMIQPGDQVEIPSEFSCCPDQEDETKLTMFSTGPAEIKLPGRTEAMRVPQGISSSPPRM